MAFPSIDNSVFTKFASVVTSMSVTMPANVSAGDRIIALVSTRYAETWTTIPSGFSEIKAQAGGSAVSQLTVFEKIADGSESSTTKIWGCTTTTTAVWQTILVKGAHASSASEATSNSGDYTTNPNPPSLSPSFGSEDILWLEIACNSASTNLTTAASTNYSGYLSNNASTGGAQANLASAYRQLNASSEDPDEMPNTGNIRYWAAATLAIRPGGGGGGPSTTGQMKVWNGGGWMAKPIKVWNGSSWVTKPAKTWNGSSWTETNY